MSLHGFVARWWVGEAGVAGKVLDAVLLPAEWGFRGVVALRNRAFDRGMFSAERVPIPVISVGNVGVGGAGKTPFAAWLAARLIAQGRRPAIALRGYGQDEVLLHRELNPDVPVFAAAKRVEAARDALGAGYDAVVLDDAFQHRRLARDADLVLIPVEGWTGAPRLLPRGPWREDVTALARADAVVLTRKTATAARAAEVAAEVVRVAPGTQVAVCHLAPGALAPLHGGDPRPLSDLAGRKVLAVAALATPRLFVDNLRASGAEVEGALYPDHYTFTDDDARTIAARAAGRTIVMTHKDAVKLRPLLPPSLDALMLTQTVEFDSGLDALDAVLRRALEARG